jgi:hypothetical protein
VTTPLSEPKSDPGPEAASLAHSRGYPACGSPPSPPQPLQVDKHLHALTTIQQTLTTVLLNLKKAEATLPAPGTGVAGQPHEAIDNIARTSQELNEVLRRVDQAQAELPAIQDATSIPSQHDLARVRLGDVDKSTAV